MQEIETMLMEAVARPLSFAEFKKLLAKELLVDEENITPKASFINDLFVDSIRMLEMILRIESLGVEIPPAAAWRIQTVGEAYEYYLNNRRGMHDRT
jgi:acyl carrier protein